MNKKNTPFLNVFIQASVTSWPASAHTPQGLKGGIFDLKNEIYLIPLRIPRGKPAIPLGIRYPLAKVRWIQVLTKPKA